MLLLTASHSEYYQAKYALKTGDYQVAEGIVETFVPMPPGGHATESFEINKIPFRYRSGSGSVFFNSEWNRGYVHDGVQVRISYKDEHILRVEIR